MKIFDMKKQNGVFWGSKTLLYYREGRWKIQILKNAMGLFDNIKQKSVNRYIHKLKRNLLSEESKGALDLVEEEKEKKRRAYLDKKSLQVQARRDNVLCEKYDISHDLCWLPLDMLEEFRWFHTEDEFFKVQEEMWKGRDTTTHFSFSHRDTLWQKENIRTFQTKRRYLTELSWRRLRLDNLFRKKDIPYYTSPIRVCSYEGIKRRYTKTSELQDRVIQVVVKNKDYLKSMIADDVDKCRVMYWKSKLRTPLILYPKSTNWEEVIQFLRKEIEGVWEFIIRQTTRHYLKYGVAPNGLLLWECWVYGNRVLDSNGNQIMIAPNSRHNLFTRENLNLFWKLAFHWASDYDRYKPVQWWNDRTPLPVFRMEDCILTEVHCWKRICKKWILDERLFFVQTLSPAKRKWIIFNDDTTKEQLEEWFWKFTEPQRDSYDIERINLFRKRGKDVLISL